MRLVNNYKTGIGPYRSWTSSPLVNRSGKYRDMKHHRFCSNSTVSDESSNEQNSKHTEDISYSMNKEKTRRKKFRSSTRERSLANGRDPLISLNMNLDYLAKSGQKNSAARAEELLLRIEKLYMEGYYDVKPDCVSYNSVMNAYILSNDVSNAGEEVERLMQRMEDLYNEDGNDALRPNVITFNTCTTR